MGLQKLNLYLYRDSSHLGSTAFEFIIYGPEIGDITTSYTRQAEMQTACFSQCSSGTYYAQDYCASCSIQYCLACSSATACHLCLPGLTPNVTSNYSSCVCPLRQFYNEQTQTC
jgi:hypothetical protein